MIKERSAGAVIFYAAEGGPEYLLLHYTAGHWDFPKGNIEPGESELETVRREVEEETGIRDIELVYGFRKLIRYHYRKGKELVSKEVVFYLAESKTKDVRISWEHTGYVWLGYEDALKKLTYKNAKELLRDAHEVVKSLLAERRSS